MLKKKRIGWRFPFKAFLKSLGVIKMTKLEIFTTRKKIYLVPTQKKMENNDSLYFTNLKHRQQQQPLLLLTGLIQIMTSDKPSFHKEGKSTIKIVHDNNKNNNTKQHKRPITPKDISSQSQKVKDSPFVEELVLTGRPNWKKAPQQIKQRYKGIYLILLSIPIMGITTFEIIRRLEGKSTKKIQQGERLSNGINRDFDEQEKIKVEKESIMYKIFGKDFFLDGFTSKTIKSNQEKKE